MVRPRQSGATPGLHAHGSFGAGARWVIDGAEVAGGGGDVLVAEELLQPAERAAAGEVAQREAVSQRVRVHGQRGYQRR